MHYSLPRKYVPVYFLFFSAVAFFLFAFSPRSEAQTTKVKGRVTDASTGEGIPFANVYFKNTTIGVTTDMDGYYTMETRDHSVNILCAMILGYEARETAIANGGFNQINFMLKPVAQSLNAVVIKPDDHYVRWILRQVHRNEYKNNPEKRRKYECDTYDKMELDLTNADAQIRNRLIRKNFGFVFQYMDTSVVSGQPYLPVMISETFSHYYHQSDPSLKKEVINASRISGIDDESTVAQFTGNMHVKTNFYDNFISIFDVHIPSPLSENGTVYYNYYLVDSLYIDGRKTYQIRFHPDKLVSSPVFDGEMSIDARDFALREMHARLKKGSNVNWVRDFVLDITHQPLPDSTWFYKQDKLYVDFSLALRDSSKMMSFLGNREIDYSNPVFDKAFPEKIIKSDTDVSVCDSAYDKKEDFWQTVRPDPLTEKEQNIYSMVDSIKNVPLYNNIYTLVNTVVNGYYNTKYIGFGPYFKVFSFNNLEGARFQAGFRTTSDFSDKWRFTAYGAYGLGDKALKGGGKIEYMFDNVRTKKITVSAKRDVIQLGKGNGAFAESNILSSLLSKNSGHKLSPANEYSMSYQHEWYQGFEDNISLESRRIFSNEYVPMLKPDSTSVSSLAYNQLRYVMRFSWDETVTRGTFDKVYLNTDYPIVTVDLSGALKGISHNDYDYLRMSASVLYHLQIPPAGVSDFRLTAGKIIGTVPYPFLYLFEGNGTYYFDDTAFACMDFYEFAADTWSTFFWEHNFRGFFLGKIPFMKKLQWREIFEIRAAYGTLSDRNNGIPGSVSSADAPLLFPSGMSSLNKPYVEMGVGVSNIFRIIRIDAFWRMTHRYHTVGGIREKADHDFALNFGLELNF
ncbi:MAG: DUF5686 and carboxypeptidase regulatory-like domain-containing protein [Bacteroidales bacterium]|nr:DUF5686 and carboxypeptidase regulatory-like domain-containing protein [Bacteroidales bacterium]MCI1784587.1 DUF5686 and carboxypeptidase regulatory-like domain-containing protein [Bacteroidales bacterium]